MKIDENWRSIFCSVGHDLAVMSLCNHTIISHGTFSFWAGFLAGGSVISPNHFPSLR
jgi:galactoside 2-L-fucosyltransferase 1/2